MFDSPEGGFSRFSWLAEPLSLDELDATPDQCNNSCLDLDRLRFSLFEALPMEVNLWLRDIYNEILATGVVPQSSSHKGHANCETWQGSFIIGLVQANKFTCLWQEAHEENDMYMFGLFDKKEWHIVSYSVLISVVLESEKIREIVWRC
jgi:hypothetical protein